MTHATAGRFWRTLATLILALPCGMASGAPAPVRIVSQGKSDYVIITSKNPSAPQALAAKEIQKYVAAMSGATLKIEAGAQPPKHAIVVGNMPDAAPNADESFAVSVDGSQIAITGGRGRSTLNAAYRFLDSLGCRFLSPQYDFYAGAAEIIPHQTDVVYSAGNRTVSPKLKFRKLYVEEGHSHTTENLKQMIAWMPKVGFNTLVMPANYQGAGKVKWDNWRKELTPELQKRDITIEVGGHGYQNFLNARMDDGKLFNEHPEWFGQDATGKRRPEINRVFCTSNPSAVDYLIKNFVAYVKNRPEIQVYDFWPPDSSRWCDCDDCKKLGSPADRQAILLGQVKHAVAKARPDLRLEMIAYASYVTPPRQKIDPSVLVDFCPIDQQFDHAIDDPAAVTNAIYVDDLRAWRKSFAGDISIYSYYRKYAWDSLPVILPHYLQKDLQWYASVPVQGVSTYSEPADWGTYELNHYALVALAIDPDADVDALVRKFCDARYGAASAVAQTALGMLEDIVRKSCSIPHTPLASVDVIDADRAHILKMREQVEAESKRASDPAVRRALDRLALMCEYAGRDLEIQSLRASHAAHDAIDAKIHAEHDFASQHADAGVFLVKDQRLSQERMDRRYDLVRTERN